MGIVGTLWVCIAENARWKTGVLSKDLEAILLCTALYLHPKLAIQCRFNIKEFKLDFQRYIILLESVIMGIVLTVWVCMQSMILERREESKKRVLFEDIAPILLCRALYLHPKISHTLYVQNKWVSSMFFNLLYYLLKICTVCVCIVENARWKTCVLSEDIATILLCTALYLKPISSYALYVQYKRVSNIVFNAIINF